MSMYLTSLNENNQRSKSKRFALPKCLQLSGLKRSLFPCKSNPNHANHENYVMISYDETSTSVSPMSTSLSSSSSSTTTPASSTLIGSIGVLSCPDGGGGGDGNVNDQPRISTTTTAATGYHNVFVYQQPATSTMIVDSNQSSLSYSNTTTMIRGGAGFIGRPNSPSSPSYSSRPPPSSSSSSASSSSSNTLVIDQMKYHMLSPHHMSTDADPEISRSMASNVNAVAGNYIEFMQSSCLNDYEDITIVKHNNSPVSNYVNYNNFDEVSVIENDYYLQSTKLSSCASVGDASSSSVCTQCRLFSPPPQPPSYATGGGGGSGGHTTSTTPKQQSTLLDPTSSTTSPNLNDESIIMSTSTSSSSSSSASSSSWLPVTKNNTNNIDNNSKSKLGQLSSIIQNLSTLIDNEHEQQDNCGSIDDEVARTYVCSNDYEATFVDDVSVQFADTVKILRDNNDDWLYVQVTGAATSSDGARCGYVPRTIVLDLKQFVKQLREQHYNLILNEQSV